MADMYLARAQQLPASRLNSGDAKGSGSFLPCLPPSSGGPPLLLLPCWRLRQGGSSNAVSACSAMQ